MGKLLNLLDQLNPQDLDVYTWIQEMEPSPLILYTVE